MKRTKSSGRIRDLFLEGDTLYSMVRWTDNAKGYIRNKELTHVSPVFHMNWPDEKGIKRGFTALGLGLTNIPFLKEGQTALVLTETGWQTIKKEDPEMDLKKLNGILSLKDDADPTDTVKALKEKAEKSETLAADIVKLTEKITDLEKRLKDAQIKDGEVKLTRSEFETLKQGAQTAIELKGKIERGEIETLVDKAINCKEPKLVPAQREDMIALGLIDRKRMEAIIKNAKPIISLGENGSDGDGPTEKDPKTQFMDAITAVQNEKKVNFTEASRIVRKQNPELAKAAGY